MFELVICLFCLAEANKLDTLYINPNDFHLRLQRSNNPIFLTELPFPEVISTKNPLPFTEH